MHKSPHIPTRPCTSSQSTTTGLFLVLLALHPRPEKYKLVQIPHQQNAPQVRYHTLMFKFRSKANIIRRCTEVHTAIASITKLPLRLPITLNSSKERKIMHINLQCLPSPNQQHAILQAMHFGSPSSSRRQEVRSFCPNSRPNVMPNRKDDTQKSSGLALPSFPPFLRCSHMLSVWFSCEPVVLC